MEYRMKSARAAIVIIFCVAGWPLATAQPKAASPAAPAAAGHLKPGLWEIVNLDETVGTTAQRSTVARTCFSAEDTHSVEKIIPPQREFGSKCESRDLKLKDETATWRVAC